MRRVLAATAFLILTGAASAHAQDFSGTYVTPNQAGGAVTLIIVQDAMGQVSGSLSGSGVSYALSGLIEEGSVLGTLSSNMGGVYMSAEFDGGQLYVTLIEPDANNQPNYATSQTLVFSRQGGAAGNQGGAPMPTAPPAQPASPTSPVASPSPQPAAPAPGSGGTQTLSGWNIQYVLPQAWQVSQNLGRMQMLASTTEAGAMFVAPGLYTNFNEVAVDVTAFFQSMGHVAYPVEQPAQTTIAGLQAMAGTYMSQDQMGQTVHSRIIAMLTPHGTGVVMSAMTTPQQMPQLAQTLEHMASTASARPPQVNQQAVAALRGRWMYYGAGNRGYASTGRELSEPRGVRDL